MVYVLRAGCLLETDQCETFFLHLFEHRQQRAMDFEFDLLGAVAGNRLVNAWITARNQPADATASGRPEHVRQIHIAPQRRANQDQLPRPFQCCRRFMAKVFEHEEVLEF